MKNVKLNINSNKQEGKMKLGTMKNTMKLNAINGSINHKYRLAVVGVSTLLLSVIAYGLVSPTVSEAQAETNVSVGSSGYSLTVSSSTNGKVDMAVSPISSGSFLMTKESLNVKTNAEGYSLYIGMAGNSNDLYLNGDANASSIPSVISSQTYTNPGAMGTNAWGYAIPQSSTMPDLTNTNLPATNGFNEGSYIDNSTSESGALWAAVPVRGDEQLVQKTSQAENTNGVDLHVFYGTKINSAKSAGIYTGTVVYTAVANSVSADIASISPSAVGNLGGTNTFTVDLGINVSDSALTGIKNNSTITIGGVNCEITSATLANGTSGDLLLTCRDGKQEITGRYNVEISVSDGSNSYGTYYIANGVEYRSVTSPQIQWITPTEIYNADETAKTIRIQTDIASSETTLNSATVSVGTHACTSPAVNVVDGKYQVSCTAPMNLTPQDYQVTIAMANGGNTLVDLNTSITYSGVSTIFGASSMQDLTAANCAATPTPSAAVKTTEAHTMAEITYDTNNKAQQIPTTNPLTDERDDQTYVVKKLADGNCWMAENLRFGSTTTNNQRAWDSTTDPSLTATTSAGATVMAGLNSAHIITVNSGAKGADDSTAFSDVNEYYQNPYIAIYDANTEDNVSGTGTKFGVLYNYCAATGGTACTPIGTTPAVSGSICPKNWDLPGFDEQVGMAWGTNPSYNNLTAAYSITVNTAQGVTDITSAPLSFPRAGRFSDGGLVNRSSSEFGLYWSSRPYGDTDAYYLRFGSTQDISQYSGSRRYGRSVRCVVAGN